MAQSPDCTGASERLDYRDLVADTSSYRHPTPAQGRSFGPSKDDRRDGEGEPTWGGISMKIFYAAVAAALVATSAGCTAMNSCGSCRGTANHITTSQFAPRIGEQQGRYRGPGLLSQLGGWGRRGAAGCGDVCGGEAASCGLFDGRARGCGGNGACSGACGGGCLQQGLGRLLDGSCGPCGGGESPCGLGRASDQNYNFNPGPPVGQVAYPYYTTRGPRDFLQCNPPSIGPR